MKASRSATLVVLCVLLGLTPVYGGVSPSGPVFRVDSPADCQERDADVAALPGGGFVSVWTGPEAAELSRAGRIHVRLFGGDAQPSGPEFLVGSGPADIQQAPAVAADASGRFLVSWHDLLRGEVMARLFEPTGIPFGAEFRVAVSGGYNGLDVAALPDGFAVVWATSGGRLNLRQYDRSGNPTGSVGSIGGGAFIGISYLSEPSITTLPAGDILLTWSTLNDPLPLSSPIGVRFGQGLRIPAGALNDPDRWTWIELNLVEGSVTDPRIAGTVDGGTVAVWREEDATGMPLGLFSRIFDASGAPRTSVRKIDDGLLWSELSRPDLLADPDGGFVVGWSGTQTLPPFFPPFYSTVYARSFDAAGAPLGAAQELAPGVAPGRERPSLARLENGQGVAVWHEGLAPESATAQCYSAGIAGRLFSAGCLPGPGRLCLGDGRFQLETTWRSASAPGGSGAGRAVRVTRDTGYFWFFDEDNVELMVKVLDGRPLNNKFWVFYGSLSDTAWSLRVTDTVTGASKTYDNPAGQLASRGDTDALPSGQEPEPSSFEALSADALAFTPAAPASAAAADAPCFGGTLPVPGTLALCPGGEGFEVTVDWHDPFNGTSGSGRGVALSSNTGYFWFFGPDNVELVVKVLDGRAVNGKFWVFYGALTNVEYTVRVRRASTGAEKTYHNPPFQFLSRADTAAF